MQITIPTVAKCLTNGSLSKKFSNVEFKLYRNFGNTECKHLQYLPHGPAPELL